ncbi:MAG TPA: cupredoxin domain-containing protein [Candidatus Paceibacterota bacterium]|nr:cupredoxin domain-containing protein [Candidatus Paceibacterota bacterium]
MNKTALLIGAIVILLLVGIFAANRTTPTETDEQIDLNIATSTTGTTSTSTATSTGTTQGAVKEFTVTGTNFKFSLPEMKVKEGDRVRVTFVNSQGTHDWRLEGYNVGTKVLQGSAQETVEFVADKKGTFEYYCSVGSHRQMGMKGNLIVE